jgi:predicted transcriptional regulator
MSEIDQIVSNFADRLTNLMLAEMRAAIEQAPRIGASGEKLTKESKRVKGEKRTEVQIKQLQARVLKLIEEFPGERMEHLSATLSTLTKDLRGPIKQLIAAKLVKVKGQKRATKYYPADSDLRTV